MSNPDELEYWYIAPADRYSYEAQFKQYAYGSSNISLSQLDDYVIGLRLSQTDVLSAWSLVDPENSQRITKEQFVYFLHIISRIKCGVRLPSTIPDKVLERLLNPNSNNVTGRIGEAATSKYNPAQAGGAGASLAHDYLAKLSANSATSSLSKAGGTNHGWNPQSNAIPSAADEDSLLRDFASLSREVIDLKSSLLLSKSESPSGEDAVLTTRVSELKELRSYIQRCSEKGSRNEDEGLESIKSLLDDAIKLQARVQSFAI